MSKSLPSSSLIVAGKFVWQTMWRIMMSQLAPSNQEGEYNRPKSEFLNQISTSNNQIYTPEKNRYRLYVGLSCPWAHRTLIVHALKGLKDVIDICIVYPSSSQGGWVMKETSEGCNSLKELYNLAQKGYKGRCTVPVLWDTKTKTIVNNESAEIIVILNSQFNDFANNSNLNLYPNHLKDKIEEWNEKIYPTVNNGVYRCGFAQTQWAYNKACTELFATLDEINEVLGENRYLCGDDLTLADIRLFTTLIRFDVAYFGLFKCSLKRIADYPHLSRYLEEIYNLKGVAETCDLEAVKKDYYGNLFPLNPSGIIPL